MSVNYDMCTVLYKYMITSPLIIEALIESTAKISGELAKFNEYRETMISR